MTVTSATLRQLKDLLPKSVAASLLAAIYRDGLDPVTLESALASVDWRRRRPQLEQILREILPVEELVPEAYELWRPVVRDGFSFIGARLDPERLAAKLVEQFLFPEDVSLEDRLIAFLRRVPILQKIGQTMARNPNLDAKLRARLTILEDGIQEVSEREIQTEVEKQLGDILARHRVEIEPGIYGEGSVSALLRFTCRTRMGIGPVAGVLKVLKPFIADDFQNEIALLAELADYFDANQERYQLGKLNLRSMLNEVRDLYESEIDFVRERENLVAAGARYSNVPGIRIPRPIPALSTETITAMTDEHGVKVTGAFPGNAARRRQLARKLIECAVARPLLSREEISPFHADLHAGNLRVDESTGDIVLLDWALTGGLTVADRRSMILLLLTLPLRDEGQMFAALSDISLSEDETARRSLQRKIENFMDALPLGSIPRSRNLGDLVNELLRTGAQFSGSFLIFRKTIATLGDVIEEISPGESIERVVLEYAVTHGLLNALASDASKSEFRIPLRSSDFLQLGFSLQSFLPRLWIQAVRGIARRAGDRMAEVKPGLERN